MTGGEAHRAGLVAIIGRPNVGKSTLLNRLVGQKVSITSRRPQTTRYPIVGIVTRSDTQFVFVDTPGLQSRHGSALNRRMDRAARDALVGVDAIVMVVEALEFRPDDQRVVDLLPADAKVVLAINKIDQIKGRDALLPFMARMNSTYPFRAIVPVSARQGSALDVLLEEVRNLLPIAPPLYDEDQITDRSERFLAAELVREKLFRLLGAELPYSTAVEIERFETEDGLRRIAAAILVDRPGQKAIVIGKGGAKLKEIATQARLEMEKLFGDRVFLEVWVKVKSGWMDDATMLGKLGYD